MKKGYDYNASSRTLRLGDSTHEGVSIVRLGEQTFYVALKDKAVEQLGLLQNAVESPEKVRELVQFLNFLRRIAPILLIDEEKSEITDTTTIRRTWLAALREADHAAAVQLQDRIEATGAKMYLSPS